MTADEADNQAATPPNGEADNGVDTEVAALLQAADQRYTDGRRRLVAALQAGGGPLTIGQIVEADPTLPQSTVYRNLTILEEVGAVTRIMTSDDFARYELTEHLTGHHHHLICSSCGDVADFALETRTENTLEQALERAARQAGFTAEDHRLDIVGTCSSCS
jgi:Fe2+ or Zn2+ uptake regulation protein